MHPNIVLGKIQKSLLLDRPTVTSIWQLAQSAEVDPAGTCTRAQLAAFLEGLILHYRGPKPERPTSAAPAVDPALVPDPINNNDILRKIRIALELHEVATYEIFAQGGIALGKHELSDMARKKGHKNYKECSDKQITAFLDGLFLTPPGR